MFKKLQMDKRCIPLKLSLIHIEMCIRDRIGTFGAIYIYQSRKKYQEAFLSLNNILMVAPDVMIGASFLILFTQLKFSLGFLTVLSSHVAFSIPIVVLMVLPRLKEMNGDMILSLIHILTT